MLWPVLLRCDLSTVSTRCESVIEVLKWPLHSGRAQITMFTGAALPSVARPLVSLFYFVVSLGWFYSAYIEPTPQPQIHRDATQKLLGPPLCMGPYVWCFILQIPAISAIQTLILVSLAQWGHHALLRCHYQEIIPKQRAKQSWDSPLVSFVPWIAVLCQLLSNTWK